MEIKKDELKKETPDTTRIPLDDAELEEATGGATMLFTGWDCPNCKKTFEHRRWPCPECGYES